LQKIRYDEPLQLVGVDQREGLIMRIANCCQRHAAALLAISKESQEFKERATGLAQMWLTIAELRHQIHASAPEMKSDSPSAH
jgi:hypothetical protein